MTINLATNPRLGTLIFFFIFFLIFFFAFCLISLSAWGLSHQFSFKHLTALENGISGNGAFALESDDKGFIWIGSENGLNRYDGVDLRKWTYNTENTSFLSNDWVTTLRWDPQGFLWVGTLGGLNRFDPVSETFQSFLHDSNDPASLSHNQINAIHIGPDHTLWVGTEEGLNRFDPESGTFRSYLFSSPAVWSLLSMLRITNTQNLESITRYRGVFSSSQRKKIWSRYLYSKGL